MMILAPRSPPMTCRKAKPRQRKHLQRNSAKTHLLTASALFALTSVNVGQATGMTIINSGRNTFGLETATNSFADPFDPVDAHHVLEASLDACPDANMQRQLGFHIIIIQINVKLVLTI